MFEQLKSRQVCEYKGWGNTTDTESCQHCVRILNYRLLLDDFQGFGYWNYINAIPERRMFLREKCISLHVNLFLDFIQMGREL